ncbi:CsbD family protein [Nocardioides yefusunii]|uniref:CsbD family protein n=1 Tax=Nocardioides yefusunii TaxID=2500546 RepID=A0ABW1R1H0_9ACTN|nr:CsbD family protein [Nocardioides yefusunii]
MGDWKHKAEEGLGKAKETVGDATGQDDLKTEGQADQAEAKVKQVGDKIKDVAQGLKDKLT